MRCLATAPRSCPPSLKRIAWLARVLSVATVVAAFGGGTTRAVGAQEAWSPPLPANLSPLHLLLLQPPAQPQQSDTRVGLGVAYATVMVSQKRGADQALLDMEVARASLQVAGAFRNGIEVWAEVPYLWFGGGAFDDALIAYHDAIGVSDGGRKDRPRNTFAYMVRRGDNVYAPNPPKGGGLGDVVVGAKAPLDLFSRGTADAAWRFFGKVPTGSPANGFGSGRVDLGTGLILAWMGDRLRLSGNVDALHFGGTQDPALHLGTPWAVSALADAGWRFDLLGTVSAGLRYLSSPYDTGLASLDRDVLMLAVGWQGRVSRCASLRLGFTEDLAVESSPDFSLFLAVEWSGVR